MNASKRRIFFLLTIITILGMALTSSLYSDLDTINDNKEKIAILEEKYEVLQKEEKSLSSDVLKLSDDEYMMRYAKEKYMYSSDGEIILRLS